MTGKKYCGGIRFMPVIKKIRISKYSIKAIIIASIFLIAITVLLIFKGSSSFDYALISIPVLLFINVMIIIFLLLADIEILDNVMIVKKIYSQKEINLSNLHIYNITIRMYPFFFMETTAGNFSINYTKNNYQYIIELAEKTGFKGIELFKQKVAKYVVALPLSDL